MALASSTFELFASGKGGTVYQEGREHDSLAFITLSKLILGFSLFFTGIDNTQCNYYRRF